MQNINHRSKARGGLSTAHCLLVALPCLVATPTLAQDAQGRSLSFGISERLEASDNLQLSASNPKSSITSATSLSFTLTNATALSNLSLTGSAVLRATSGEGAANLERGLVEPNLKLSYGRTVSNSALSLNASLSTKDIANSTFSTIDPDTGLPIDTTGLSGTGSRQNYALGAELNLEQDSPLSYTLSAGVSGVNYVNASNAALTNSRRVRFGAAAHFDFTEVATASLGLRYMRFTNGATERVTSGLDADLAIARPNGSVTAVFSLDHTPDGNRSSLSFGRSYDLPQGTLSGSIGLTRGVTGSNSLTGALNYAHDLYNGKISLGLRQSVTSGETTDAETKATGLSLGYQRALSELSSVAFDASFSKLDTSASTSLTATYTYSLTEDWGLNLGLRHRIKRADSSDTATSNTLFLELSRSFTALR